MTLLFLAVLSMSALPNTLPKQLNVTGQSRLIQSCEVSSLPEVTNSPHPLMKMGSEVTADFVVRDNGRVYNPVILEASDGAEARNVLNVIKTWQFHPATCNGTPVDSETIVTFDTR